MDEPFVGRTAELAELRRQFELATAGQGRVVVLEGPAGGGKTALIRRCLQGCAGRAETVLLSGDETELALAGGLADHIQQGCLTEERGVLHGDLIGWSGASIRGRYCSRRWPGGVSPAGRHDRGSAGQRVRPAPGGAGGLGVRASL